jgi:tetratricopeptide (TPR) repeat protein
LKKIAVFIILVLAVKLFSQNDILQPGKEDSILNIIKSTVDVQKKVDIYLELAARYQSIDEAKEMKYLEKAEFEADQSRNRKIMAETYVKVFDQHSNLMGAGNRSNLALEAAEKGLAISTEANFTELTAIFHMKKGIIYRGMAKFNNALKSNIDAVTVAESTNNDSLKIITNLSHAKTLMEKDENLAAFKKLSNTLFFSENTKYKNLTALLCESLGDFYSKLDQIEKAKDYYMKCLKIQNELKNTSYVLEIYSKIAYLHANKKELKIAYEYLDRMKDYVKNSTSTYEKNKVLFTEVNIIFEEDLKKAGKYIKDNPKMINDLMTWGYESEAYRAKGLMYTLTNKRDSAETYYKLALKSVDKNPSASSYISVFAALGMHYEQFMEFKKAIEYREKAISYSQTLGILSHEKKLREELDSLYRKIGDKQNFYVNKFKLENLKDSLDQIQKTKDVLNIEIDLENKRIEREEKLASEALRKKHNLQYMGITAFIAGIFIILALLGKFKVRPNIIRGLGFLSFILLFEFIILLADKEIHHITHGDPLSILLIKIVLIAILMPLHHYLEHKALTYLTRHQHLQSN